MPKGHEHELFYEVTHFGRRDRILETARAGSVEASPPPHLSSAPLATRRRLAAHALLELASDVGEGVALELPGADRVHASHYLLAGFTRPRLQQEAELREGRWFAPEIATKPSYGCNRQGQIQETIG